MIKKGDFRKKKNNGNSFGNIKIMQIKRGLLKLCKLWLVQFNTKNINNIFTLPFSNIIYGSNVKN